MRGEVVAHRDGDDMKTRHRQRSWLPILVCTLAGGWALLACGPGVWEPVPDPPQHIKYDTVRIEYGEGDDRLDPTQEDFEQVQQTVKFHTFCNLQLTNIYYQCSTFLI